MPRFLSTVFALLWCSPIGLLGQGVISAGWTATQNQHAAAPGSQRLLLYVAAYESDPGTDLTALTYGGQAMTQLTDRAEGIYNRVEIWYLLDAGIAAAVDDVFVPTFSDGAPYGGGYYTFANTLKGVDQNNPFQSVSGAGASNVATLTMEDELTAPAFGYMFYATSDGDGTRSHTQEDAWTEHYELVGTWGEGQLSTLSDVTADYDFGSQPESTFSGPVNRVVMAGAGVNPSVASLPVTLESFTATGEGESVALRWRVSLEEETEHYTVYRSTDGKSWLPLPPLPASGQTEYGITDKPPGQYVRLLYRLAYTEWDGTEYFLATAQVVREAIRLHAYPNPTQGPVDVVLPTSLLSQPVRLTNHMGQDLTGVVSVIRREDRLRIDLTGQPRGQYVLRIGERTVRIQRL